MRYYTVKQTYYCPTNYGLYECRLENGKEVCKLIACVVRDSLTTPL
ncbi:MULTISPECIES: hypothetical protein [Sulfolobaceae]|uniref:Uncharacterized protein n=2 Tax=Sulfurisphaera TaxID=69655 RepID=A0A7J9RRN6_SULOH|nr:MULTISPECIES: hypothetical protein [Sulfolobaceae]MBB5253583.1 hypothetical protein [Sulfurisphaera ohwakuensis]HII73100.1 hypothetical protein [Sulfurisphaera tokodaii]